MCLCGCEQGYRPEPPREPVGFLNAMLVSLAVLCGAIAVLSVVYRYWRF